MVHVLGKMYICNHFASFCGHPDGVLDTHCRKTAKVSQKICYHMFKTKGGGGGRHYLTMLKSMQKWYRAASLTRQRYLQHQPQQQQQHQQVGIFNNQFHTYQGTT